MKIMKQSHNHISIKIFTIYWHHTLYSCYRNKLHALILCGCVTNYHGCNNLKQHTVVISEFPRVRVQGWDGAASCLGPHEVLARLLLIPRSHCGSVCPCSQGCWQYCFLRSQDSRSLASSESTKGGKVSLPADGTMARRAVLVTIAGSCGLEPSHRPCSVSWEGIPQRQQQQDPGPPWVCLPPSTLWLLLFKHIQPLPGLPRFLSVIAQTQSSSAPHWN